MWKNDNVETVKHGFSSELALKVMVKVSTSKPRSDLGLILKFLTKIHQRNIPSKKKTSKNFTSLIRKIMSHHVIVMHSVLLIGDPVKTGP